VSIDSLIRAIDQERTERRLQVEALLERVSRDRGGRTIEYRMVTDTFALALLHRKDTTIDSLSVALVREQAEHDTTRFLLDTMTLSRGRWRSAYESRTREVEALRKVLPSTSWWRERIKPRATVGYGAVLSRDGTVHHGPSAQLGFQIFP
jgi:hypothetical protein